MMDADVHNEANKCGRVSIALDAELADMFKGIDAMLDDCPVNKGVCEEAKPELDTMRPGTIAAQAELDEVVAGIDDLFSSLSTGSCVRENAIASKSGTVPVKTAKAVKSDVCNVSKRSTPIQVKPAVYQSDSPAYDTIDSLNNDAVGVYGEASASESKTIPVKPVKPTVYPRKPTVYPSKPTVYPNKPVVHQSQPAAYQSQAPLSYKEAKPCKKGIHPDVVEEVEMEEILESLLQDAGVYKEEKTSESGTDLVKLVNPGVHQSLVPMPEPKPRKKKINPDEVKAADAEMDEVLDIMLQNAGMSKEADMGTKPNTLKNRPDAAPRRSTIRTPSRDNYAPMKNIAAHAPSIDEDVVICDICGGEIEGPRVKALGRSYHRKCFHCAHCKEDLRKVKGGFVSRTDKKGKRKLYCKYCDILLFG